MNELTNAPSPTGNALFDPESFKHMGSVAAMMVDSKMMPAHLRGQMQKGKMVQEFTRDRQIATAFLIVNAARLFEADPFSFAQTTFIVHGKLDFNGSTYAALANNRANLAGRLQYKYFGEGGEQRCVCIGRFRDEPEERIFETPTFEQCSRDRAGQIRDAWKDCNPQQQLGYYAARSWVRRHCPEILLGLASDVDDADEPTEEPVLQAKTKDTIRLLENPPTMAIHLAAIEAAQTIDELRVAREQFDNDDTLETRHQQTIILAGRQRAAEIEANNTPEVNSAPDWSAVLAEHESVLHDSDDPQAVSEAWECIESIKQLPPSESKRLGDLYNERMREFNEPIDQI